MSYQKIKEGRLRGPSPVYKESSIYCSKGYLDSTKDSESFVEPLSEWMDDRELGPSNVQDRGTYELNFERNQSLEPPYNLVMNTSMEAIFSSIYCDDSTRQPLYGCLANHSYWSQLQGEATTEYLKTAMIIKELGTNYFKGGRSTFPADSWLQNLEKNFSVTRCPEEYKKNIFVYYLKKDAANWWTNLEKQFGDKEPTWEDFRREFEKKYFLQEIAAEEEAVLRRHGVHSLLDGHDLAGYLDGSTVPPNPTITSNNNQVKIRPKQPGDAKTNSSTMACSPKHFSKDDKTINEYMQGFTTKFDQLWLLGKPIEHEEQVEFILQGLYKEYMFVADQVEGRESPPSIVKIHEKLHNKEEKLLTMLLSTSNTGAGSANVATTRPRPFQVPKEVHSFNNISLDHKAACCPPSRLWQPRANMAIGHKYPVNGWLLDSEATHHMTSDLNNLAMHQPYHGNDSVLI
ncbi:unnamed protein product, partial [Arabidopsis halleri]